MSCSDTRHPSRVVGPTAPGASLRFLRSALPPLGGDDGLSQVPGEPSRACRVLRPRQDPRARPFGRCPTHRLADVASTFSTASAPAIESFEALSRGLHVRCLRFVTRVTLCRHARLASGWWPTLAGRGSNPLGSNVKFRSCHLHGVLLTQAWPGAPRSFGAPPAARRFARDLQRARGRTKMMLSASLPPCFLLLLFTPSW